MSGPLCGLKKGDRLTLQKALGCWAPAGEVVKVAEVTGNGNGVVVVNRSGERMTLVGESGARLLGVNI